MMSIKLLILMIFCVLNARVAMAKEVENYCHDASVNKEWAVLLGQHPDDDAIAKLFAMRLGLCELVERGFIEHDRATKIFEDARANEVKKKKKMLNKKDKQSRVY